MEILRNIRQALGFNRHSGTIFSVFFLTCLLIIYIWQPLVKDYFSAYDPAIPWYYYIDWLLIGIFAFMSLTIMARADLRTDALIIFVGMCGGLVIESWGTQTNIWHYYTAERPPLWIIPAWPIASLSIDRITRAMDHVVSKLTPKQFGNRGRNILLNIIYWACFGIFYLMMLQFTFPTLEKSYTQAALFICAVLIIFPRDRQMALLVFISGTGLGYFLERWGTTRECWTYYTGETPPLFAVMAHGMAAVSFWRTGLILKQVFQSLQTAGEKLFGKTVIEHQKELDSNELPTD